MHLTFVEARGRPLRNHDESRGRPNALAAQHSPQVIEAQRIVSLQCDCSMNDALELLHNTAEVTDETLEQIARMVIHGSVTFDPST